MRAAGGTWRVRRHVDGGAGGKGERYGLEVREYGEGAGVRAGVENWG